MIIIISSAFSFILSLEPSPPSTSGRIEGSAINDVIGSVLDNVGASHKERQAILRGIIGQQQQNQPGMYNIQLTMESRLC